MEKIPLEERLKRLRAGYCSSKEYILPGLVAFAEMPAITLIRRLFSDLQKDYENFIGTRYRKDVADVTYGDLAVIIAEDYMKNGVHDSPDIDKLMLFFFTSLESDYCFSSVRDKVKSNAVDRDAYLERIGIKDILGYSDVTVGEYLDSVKDIGLPPKISSRLYAFSIEKPGVMSMTLLKVYQDLNAFAIKYDQDLTDPIDAGYAANSMMIRELMTELLVIPVACLRANA